MRTAIFVYEPTTVTIETAEDQLQLTRLAVTTAVPLAATNTVAVDPGVYKIVSSQRVTVTAPDTKAIHVVSTPNDKDGWPDPPAVLPIGLGAEPASIRAFFAIADSKQLGQI